MARPPALLPRFLLGDDENHAGLDVVLAAELIVVRVLDARGIRAVTVILERDRKSHKSQFDSGGSEVILPHHQYMVKIPSYLNLEDR